METFSQERIQKALQIVRTRSKLSDAVQVRLGGLVAELERVLTEIERLGDVLRCKEALGYAFDDQVFLVFAGSSASGNPNRFFQKILVESGVLAPKGERYIFTRDYVFSKPSPAASTILGRDANGKVEWKNGQGKTLEELSGR